jgi:hypothetical protein
MDAIQRFERTLTSVETAFNIAGSTPAVSVFSSMLRVALGKIQAVVGSIFATAGFVGTLLTRGDTQKIFEKMMTSGIEHTLHGVANIVRGVTEFVLGMTFFGSLIPLIVQATSENGFAPRFTYIQTPVAHREQLALA